MKPDIESILAAIAMNIGTTVEHLWGVLIKQSTISAISDFITCTLWIIGFVYLFKGVKKLINKRIVIDKYGDEVIKRDIDEAIVWIIWTCMIVVSLIMVISVTLSIENIINASFNPEYWALEKILSLIRKH